MFKKPYDPSVSKTKKLAELKRELLEVEEVGVEEETRIARAYKDHTIGTRKDWENWKRFLRLDFLSPTKRSKAAIWRVRYNDLVHAFKIAEIDLTAARRMDKSLWDECEECYRRKRVELDALRHDYPV
jgi:hypothetical protein